MVDVRRKDRARKEAAKQERRQAILNTAWQMFQATPYQAITMADVAEKTALAKGTVYLYFKTKEALFLTLAQQQLAFWFAEIDAALQVQSMTANELTLFFSRSLDGRDGLVRLLAMLHSILEQNVDLMTALDFKHRLVEHIGHTGALLEQRLGFFNPGQGAQFLLRVHALIVGLHSLAELPSVMHEVMKAPGMDTLVINFRQEFSETLQALLSGMERE